MSLGGQLIKRKKNINYMASAPQQIHDCWVQSLTSFIMTCCIFLLYAKRITLPTFDVSHRKL